MKRIIVIVLISCFLRPSFSQVTTGQKLDKLISSYVRSGKFNGSVLISKNGRIILEKGYGYRNFKEKSLNNPNTIYQIASITKQFTSAVILKLAELNKLSLTDKIGTYFPGFPEGDSITIENLLTHTSGIPDWTNNTEHFSPEGEESLLSFLKTRKLEFSPGKGWNYSNSNYSLLGYIIQKVTGNSYENEVRQYIFNPLGMNHSGFDFKHLESPDKATGYSTFSESPKIEASIYDSTATFAAGAIYSTAEDLKKWDEGLQSNKIISRNSFDKAVTPLKNNYGYGWQIDSLFGRKVTSHSGSIAGFCSNIARIQEDSVVVILLNNKEGSGLESITRNIFSILYEQPGYLTGRQVVLSKKTLKKYTGTYEVMSPHGNVTGKIFLKNGKLFFKERDGSRFELFADNENRFYGKDYQAEVQFKAGTDGKIAKIIMTQNGKTIFGEKVR